jgi:hypothetical protein
MTGFVLQKGAYSRTVLDSPELRRIAALPRHDIEVLADKAEHIINQMVQPVGDMLLRPLQLQALTAAFHTGGLAGLLSVGSGKTLVACLIPSLYPDSRALILARAGLVSQGERMTAEYSQSFYVSSSIRWMSYDFLSREGGTDILMQLQPDIIIADEAQCLANPKAARTKRFVRYMEAHPNTMFFFLSGTITRHSIRDFAHLMQLALGTATPLPRDWATITEWGECIDSDQGVRYPGHLRYLGVVYDPLPDIESARVTLQKRIKATLGVVASNSSSADASILIKPMKVKLSPKIKEAVCTLQDTWCRPDGDELVTAIEVATVKSQLQLGGHYRWSKKPPRDWLDARRDWHRELRDFLNKHSKEGLDSPFLVVGALLRNEDDRIGSKIIGKLAKCYAAWLKQANSLPTPPVTWDWTDKGHLENLALHIKKLGPCIVWSSFSVPSVALAKMLGAPYYGAAEGDRINAEDGSRTIVASLRAHKEGRNLQAFSSNVLVGNLSAGADAEQLIGRTHRAGQKADEIQIHVPVYLKDNIEKCISDGKYLEQITGNPQKIVFADKEEWPW